MNLLATLATVFVVAVIGTAVTLYSNVQMLLRMKVKPFVAKPGRTDDRIKATIPAREWADAHDFIFVGYYTVGSVFLAGWRHRERPSWLCYYLLQGRAFTDFVTQFDADIGLTTGSTRSGQFYPKRPESFAQTFSTSDFDDLWARHIESENYLMDHGEAQLVPFDGDFGDLLTEATQKQISHVRTVPLWPLRGLWWYCVRRYRRHNLTLQQQHQKKLIRLPNQIGRRV